MTIPSVVDISAEFDNFFREFSFRFSSYSEFTLRLRQFQRATGTCYVQHSATTITNYVRHLAGYVNIPAAVKYQRLRLICVHAPYRLRTSTERRRRFDDFNCPAEIVLGLRKGALEIRSRNAIHSHTLQMDPSAYPQNRQLTASEKACVEELLDVGTSSRVIINYMKKRYDADLTMPDIRYIKRRKRLREHQSKDVKPENGTAESIETFLGDSSDTDHCCEPPYATETVASMTEDTDVNQSEISPPSGSDQLTVGRPVTDKLLEVMCNLSRDRFEAAMVAVRQLTEFLQNGKNVQIACMGDHPDCATPAPPHCPSEPTTSKTSQLRVSSVLQVNNLHGIEPTTSLSEQRKKRKQVFYLLRSDGELMPSTRFGQ